MVNYVACVTISGDAISDSVKCLGVGDLKTCVSLFLEDYRNLMGDSADEADIEDIEAVGRESEDNLRDQHNVEVFYSELYDTTWFLLPIP